MKKNTFLPFFLLAIFVFSSFVVTKTKPTQLEWDKHFKGLPNQNSAFLAETHTHFSYKYNVKIRNGVFSIQFKFESGVDSLTSWVKKDKLTTETASLRLLNHEQGHANIGFLLAKEGEIRITQQNYNQDNYKTLIDQTGKEVRTFYREMQKRYDLETQHGVDLVAQKKWDDFLKKEINKYN